MISNEEVKMAENKWIKFVLVEEKPKTNVWSIQTTESELEIGIIKWRPSWRKYCFFPDTDTVWSVSCLMGVIDFLNAHNSKRENPNDTN